jgi:hypothetical protein
MYQVIVMPQRGIIVTVAVSVLFLELEPCWLIFTVTRLSAGEVRNCFISGREKKFMS